MQRLEGECEPRSLLAPVLTSFRRLASGVLGRCARCATRRLVSEWLSRSCKETGKHIKLSFGRDSFLYCGIEVAGNTSFALLTSLVQLSASWHCRVAVTPAAQHFVPFVLPLWGVAEGDQLHVDNHVNFALHADAGKVLAVAAYPVRDRFQFVKDGSVVSFHGPIRWFNKGSFSPLASAPAGERASAAVRGGGAAGGWACSPTMAAAWSAVSTLVTTAVWSALYLYRLKPQLVRSCLKAR